MNHREKKVEANIRPRRFRCARCGRFSNYEEGRNGKGQFICAACIRKEITTR